MDSPKKLDFNITIQGYRKSVSKPGSKVEKILKGCLDSIPSPSPSVKIQIMGGKACLRCKGLKTKSLLTSPINVLGYYLK